MLYLSLDGTPYGGDRQQRPDGSFDPILPDRPSPAYQWDGTTWVLSPQAPDWDAFRTSMMNDAAYQRIAVNVMVTAQGNWVITTLQDVITMPSPSVLLFQPLWNQAIQLTPLLLKPIGGDVTRWQSYADGSHVGLKFQANGTIAS